ncbi:MAG: cyclin-dependent kinase inhibitor 3 family protein [Chlorobium sp.]|nr:cyclin-dependent kinase inhibitor 3 family protein [Chlorobium sp.]
MNTFKVSSLIEVLPMNKAITSENSPLRIDTIVLPGNHGHIGMTFCPGKKDHGYSGTAWDRNLGTDLDAIADWGADAVVTLMEEFEMQMLGVPALPSLLEGRYIEWHHLPIRDVDIPDHHFEERWLESGQRIKSILSGGGKILIHCRGGIGRTGTIAAKLLVEFGFKPSDAVALVRRTRPGTIETKAQEQYVLKLKKWPAHSTALSSPMA